MKARLRVNERVLRYIAEEVQRQQDRPVAVYWMARAWSLAMDHWDDGGPPVRPLMVEEWGRLVHPEANAEGFRRCGVMVGRHFPPHWSEVPDLVAHLCRKIDESAVTPDEAYLEFQQVHPFRDGNGRTGKVLYNYLRRTLRRPVMPPNFFNCSNP